MTNLPSNYTLEFWSCTGFGDAGRSLSIRDTAGNEIYGGGCGATDEEAILVTLTGEVRDGGAGLSYDAAFDAAGEVLRNATRVIRHA